MESLETVLSFSDTVFIPKLEVYAPREEVGQKMGSGREKGGLLLPLGLDLEGQFDNGNHSSLSNVFLLL